MVERVKEKPERNQVNLIRGDVTYLPFRPHAFDMVISIHVLHLLKKWKQAVLETKRVLKPKGSFIVADHNAPELENELGKKYLELDANTIKKRSGLKNLSTKLDISNTMCLAKEFFEHKRIKLLNCMLEKVRERNYWQSYLKRKASSIETYVILWKEIISVSKIVDLLDKRFSSLEEGLSTETYGKIKMELAKWRIEKTKTNPFLEIRREFNFTMVQF
jgi:ubiquinone/menaquinone biosynthesis C-methylase UbiE